MPSLAASTSSRGTSPTTGLATHKGTTTINVCSIRFMIVGPDGKMTNWQVETTPRADLALSFSLSIGQANGEKTGPRNYEHEEGGPRVVGSVQSRSAFAGIEGAGTGPRSHPGRSRTNRRTGKAPRLRVWTEICGYDLRYH